MDNSTVGVELLCRMSTVIGKFLDQVLISLTKFILRAVGNGQRFCAKMLQQVFQKSIWKTVFIGPSPVTEDALKLFGICIFDLPESLNNSYANIF